MPPTDRSRTPPPRAVVVGLAVGWIVIVVKCLFVPTVIEHWQIPIRPAWVIVPTLLFAVVVTVLALAHDWTRDSGRA
jgi:preprotein translocase subunit Sec61beta